MRSLFARLAAATIWSRNGVSAADWRFRGLFRFVLPLTDLFFLYFGVVGFIGGVSSVQHAAGHTWAACWSIGIAASALGAMIGVAFPKLWAVELGAKIVLIGLVSAYVALFAAKIITDFHTSASTGLVLILILLPVWRVGDLGVVAWKRGHGGHQ